MTKPTDAELRALVRYLEKLGLKVYGNWTNLKTGAMGYGLMDFDPKDVIIFRRLHDEKRLFDNTQAEIDAANKKARIAKRKKR